jgi:apolipoprotein N-acyltransferase
MTEERREKTYEHHRALTRQATSTHPNLDLVIWPESMFVDAEQLAGSPPPAEELRRQLLGYTEDFHALMASESSQVNINTAQDHSGTKLLVGTTTIVYGSSTRRIYNAALLADRTGNIVGRYYKMHPVMFGEYIPFGDAIPLLYRITPMSGGLSVGDGPKVFEVAGLKMSPSICFESTVPHLIRRQLRQLGREGTPADVLVNVTNDGWFWGTAMLDLHFRCGIFRAVENRKPLIVAANTGISTWVDGRGLIRARGPRRQPQVLIAEVQADGRVSPYSRLGDWPAWPCAAFCICLAAVGLRRRPS